LYGTNEDGIDETSVDDRSTEQLMAALGSELDEVMRRSVRHSDTVSGWAAVCEQLPPGRARMMLEAALVERELSQ